MTNYVASTTINFEKSRFYFRPGDMLSYDPQHSGGSLAIYRNGQLVKVLRVESLAIEAFLKSRFISEVRVPAKPGPPATKEAPPRENAGTITIDTLASGYASPLKAAEPAPDPHGLLTPPSDPPLTSPHLTGFKRLLPDYNAFPSDLGVALVDGQARVGPPGETPKRERKRKKPAPAGEIDFAVHPPDPPPSQVQGPSDPPEQPEHNRISEP